VRWLITFIFSNLTKIRHHLGQEVKGNILKVMCANLRRVTVIYYEQTSLELFLTNANTLMSEVYNTWQFGSFHFHVREYRINHPKKFKTYAT